MVLFIHNPSGPDISGLTNPSLDFRVSLPHWSDLSGEDEREP